MMARETDGQPLLDIQQVEMRFGGILALDRVSLSVKEGTIHSVVGPNGAGKTTLFNCITGVYRPQVGSIRFKSLELLHRPPHQISRLGVARTFQNVVLFPELSVLQNVLVGAEARPGVRKAGVRASERFHVSEALSLLAELNLGAYAQFRPNDVPFGTRKLVELARAVMSHPAVVLLDEPTAGLQAGEIDALPSVLRRLQTERGITFVIIAHHFEFVMRVSNSVSVLHYGRKIAEGSPQEVRADAAVQEAYLGTGQREGGTARC